MRGRAWFHWGLTLGLTQYVSIMLRRTNFDAGLFEILYSSLIFDIEGLGQTISFKIKLLTHGRALRSLDTFIMGNLLIIIRNYLTSYLIIFSHFWRRQMLILFVIRTTFHFKIVTNERQFIFHFTLNSG